MKRTAAPLVISALLAACAAPVAPVDGELDVSALLEQEQDDAQLSISESFLTVAELSIASDLEPQGRLLLSEEVISLGEDGAALAFATLPPALYSRLRFQLKAPSPGTEVPDAFEGDSLSVLLRGEAEVEGETVPLVFRDDKVYVFDLALKDGLDLLPGEQANLQVLQSFASAFRELALEDIRTEDLTDGVLLLDFAGPNPPGSPNQALRRLSDDIRRALERSFRTNEPASPRQDLDDDEHHD